MQKSRMCSSCARSHWYVQFHWLICPTNQISGPKRLLTEVEQIIVVQSVLHQPGIYLHEVQKCAFFCYWKCVMFQPFVELFHDLRPIPPHTHYAAQWQCTFEDRSWLEYLLLTPKHFFGLMKLVLTEDDCIRQYGYSLRGVTPVSLKLQVGGKRISTIPVLTSPAHDKW